MEPLRTCLGKLKKNGTTPGQQESLEAMWDAITRYVNTSKTRRADLWQAFLTKHVRDYNDNKINFQKLIDLGTEHEEQVVLGIRGDSSDESPIENSSDEEPAARTKVQQAEGAYNAATSGPVDHALIYENEQAAFRAAIKARDDENKRLTEMLNQSRCTQLSATHVQPAQQQPIQVQAQAPQPAAGTYLATPMIDVICPACYHELRVPKLTAYTCSECGSTHHGTEVCQILRYKLREAERKLQSEQQDPDPSKACTAETRNSMQNKNNPNPRYKGWNYQPDYGRVKSESGTDNGCRYNS
eukprot:1973240-Rhodomonas_salina.1